MAAMGDSTMADPARDLKNLRDSEQSTKTDEMFRKVLAIVIVIGMSFFFAFSHTAEMFKPASPKEKLDAEVLAGLFAVLSTIILYLLVPLFVALVVAQGYGDGWKDIRSGRAKRWLGYVYSIYFLILYVSMMCWVLTKSANGHSIDETKALQILAGEILLTLSFLLVLAVILKVYGYGLGDVKSIHKIFVQNLENVDEPWWMLSKNAEKWKSVKFTRHIALATFMYITMTFMLASSIMAGKMEIMLDLAKIIGVLAAIFLPIWVAAELYERRNR